MTSIDTEQFRDALLEERQRVEHALATLRDEHPGSLDDEVEEVAASDNHLAETASATLGREIDYTLGDNAEQVISEIDDALKRIEDGTYGTCSNCGREIPARAAGGVSLGVSLHRLQAQSRGRVNEPARQLEVRVGSATDALTPLSRATRSFAATRAQWLALAAIALAAVVADQVTKHVVASHLRLGEGLHVVGPFTIRHVQNSGIAFGLFSNATAAVIVVTAIAIAWMLAYFARSGARHPVLPVALGLVIGGSVSNLADRVRLGFVTDFLDFRYWPAFNLADSFIVIGVGILLAALVLSEREPRTPKR